MDTSRFIQTPEDRLYPSDNDFEIPTLLLDCQPRNGLLLPCRPWGSCSRLKQGVSTWHFYVEDYRFKALWNCPQRILATGCKEIVEPNFSMSLTMPVAYGLQELYKKRWIARWLQEFGIGIWVDLKVSAKFREYNLLGVPDGYNAFATRCYDEGLDNLKAEFEIAQRVSGKETPNMVVYGGGRKAKDFCQAHGLLYLEQHMVAMRDARKEGSRE